MRRPKPEAGRKPGQPDEYSASLVVAGGGPGGCAAALASLWNGLTVMLTEFQDYIRSQGIEMHWKFKSTHLPGYFRGLFCSRFKGKTNPRQLDAFNSGR